MKALKDSLTDLFAGHSDDASTEMNYKIVEGGIVCFNQQRSWKKFSL